MLALLNMAITGAGNTAETASLTWRINDRYRSTCDI